MNCNRPLQVVCLILFAGVVPLMAQGSETKFKAIGFKPGDAYHSDENVQVSLNGGGLEVSIPLGPPMPGPIPIRPVIHYHGKYVQSLNTISYTNLPSELEENPCVESADYTGFKRWLPPVNGFGEIHPGYLLFSVGTANQPPSPTIVANTFAGRHSEYYPGMAGTYTYRSDVPSDVAEIDAMVSGVAPEWIPMSATSQPCIIPPHPNIVFVNHLQPLGSSIGARLGGGTILVYGPSNAQVYSIYPMTFWGMEGSVVEAAINSIPNEILQIDENMITLWRRNRNVYHKRVTKVVTAVLNGFAFFGDQESAMWDRSVFHPVWIKTRDGFKVNVETFRGPSDSGSTNGCLGEGGPLSGFKVSSNSGSTWFQVGGPPGTTPEYPVSFGGMGLSGTNGITFSLSREGQHPFGPDDSWQPGTSNGYNNCPLFCGTRCTERVPPVGVRDLNEAFGRWTCSQLPPAGMVATRP